MFITINYWKGKGFKYLFIEGIMSYEFLEHTADVKFRVKAANLGGAFIDSASALNEIIRGDIKILELEEKSFEVEGSDLESLLYNFLEEFLYLLDAEDFLVSRIKEVRILDKNLSCVVVGDSASKYNFTNDVKAITYNEMKIVEEKGKFIIEGVFDV
jgi:SHS2 domain-containing protein